MIESLRDVSAGFHFPRHVVDAALDAVGAVAEGWKQRDAYALRVSAKVVRVFAEAGISDAHLQGTTGYGYHDFGRQAYEAIVAAAMDADVALARPQLVSGTQAIVATIAALAGPNGRVCSLTGRPYDTLRMALVDHPNALCAAGNTYEEVEWAPRLLEENRAVVSALRRTPAVAFVQRSRGYAPRPSATIDDIERLIAIVRRESPGTLVVVDNCYGEFVELREPSAAGADAVVGSLIKNPGGGMAPTGAYVAGTRATVAKVCDRIFAPGLGAAIGPSLDLLRSLFAGLHRAPKTVAESLKILDFAAALFTRLGYDVDPGPCAIRTDIIQAIRLGTPERLRRFACGLQRLLGVNSRATPVPGPVPGYADPVIMAGGAFVSGSTIELSCDAPMREPFEVYLQGGMDVGHGMLAVMSAAAEVESERPRDEQAPRRQATKGSVMTGDLHRRQYVRVEVSLPVEFSIEGEPVGHDGSVFDLGAGGMRLVASHDLPPRANVHLKFRLPAAERGIAARGRVVLSFFQRSEQKFHHGIAFTSLDPKDRIVISDFVDRQETQRNA